MRTLQVQEFARNPTLKQIVRQQFKELGMLTIRPTEKGLIKIDDFHPYFVRLLLFVFVLRSDLTWSLLSVSPSHSRSSTSITSPFPSSPRPLDSSTTSRPRETCSCRSTSSSAKI